MELLQCLEGVRVDWGEGGIPCLEGGEGGTPCFGGEGGTHYLRRDEGGTGVVVKP